MLVNAGEMVHLMVGSGTAQLGHWPPAYLRMLSGRDARAGLTSAAESRASTSLRAAETARPGRDQLPGSHSERPART